GGVWRLQECSDRYIRTTGDPDGTFERSPSLRRVERDAPGPRFDVAEADGTLRVSAAGVSAEVSLEDGRVAFFDGEGRPLLAEAAGGRGFTPVRFDGRDYYSVR